VIESYDPPQVTGPGSSFNVKVERVAGMVVVAPSGELDIATVDRLRAAVAQRSGDESLMLDLRGLCFLDTSGLQLVMEAHRQSVEESWPLRIVRGAREVQRVFDVAGLEDALPFVDAPDAGKGQPD
jgi:anti-anti-sigma factor